MRLAPSNPTLTDAVHHVCLFKKGGAHIPFVQLHGLPACVMQNWGTPFKSELHLGGKRENRTKTSDPGAGNLLVSGANPTDLGQWNHPVRKGPLPLTIPFLPVLILQPQAHDPRVASP